MENLITRLRHMGALLLIGFLLIIYIGFGFLYLQQAPQQRELEEQITKLSLVVSRPLPSGEKLQAEYEEVKSALTVPETDSDTIAILVGIAEENRIDTDPDSGKFTVPSASFSEAKVGGGTYQVLSFTGIHVQATYGRVMAFISDLDSGKTLKTMVLKRVDISQTETETVASVDVDIYTKPEG